MVARQAFTARVPSFSGASKLTASSSACFCTSVSGFRMTYRVLQQMTHTRIAKLRQQNCADCMNHHRVESKAAGVRGSAAKPLRAPNLTMPCIAGQDVLVVMLVSCAAAGTISTSAGLCTARIWRNLSFMPTRGKDGGRARQQALEEGLVQGGNFRDRQRGHAA